MPGREITATLSQGRFSLALEVGRKKRPGDEVGITPFRGRSEPIRCLTPSDQDSQKPMPGRTHSKGVNKTNR